MLFYGFRTYSITQQKAVHPEVDLHHEQIQTTCSKNGHYFTDYSALAYSKQFPFPHRLQKILKRPSGLVM